MSGTIADSKIPIEEREYLTYSEGFIYNPNNEIELTVYDKDADTFYSIDNNTLKKYIYKFSDKFDKLMKYHKLLEDGADVVDNIEYKELIKHLIKFFITIERII